MFYWLISTWRQVKEEMNGNAIGLAVVVIIFALAAYFLSLNPVTSL